MCQSPCTMEFSAFRFKNAVLWACALALHGVPESPAIRRMTVRRRPGLRLIPFMAIEAFQLLDQESQSSVFDASGTNEFQNRLSGRDITLGQSAFEQNARVSRLV